MLATLLECRLATRKPVGRPPKRAETQPFTLRFSKELHRQLRLYAVHNGKSLNDVLVEAVEQWWAQQPERAKFVRLGREQG
jgi:predicted HicB family RNase H-like nuclease